MIAGVSKNKTSGWAERLCKELIAKAEELKTLENGNRYLSARRRHTFWQKSYQESQKLLEKERKLGGLQADIEHLEEELEGIVEDMKACSEQTGFGDMNQKIRGAKEFLSVVKPIAEQAKKVKKLERLDQAEYLFLQAIRTKAGKFNKMHGSMELTAARGMLAVERRQPVYDITCQAYAGTDPDLKNLKVKEVMDWWLELAGILYKMGLLMKSQKKMTEDRIKLLEVWVVKYAVLWQKKVTYKNPVFWKMHIMECCFVNFVIVTGMSGRSLAEGMENKHFQMAKLKAMMAPIVKTDV